MSKKIVILLGSARKNGNSAAMAHAFMTAAQAKGHTVIVHNAALMNVGGCHGCETCYSTGRPCTFDDGFNSIANDLLTADGIVFAMPLYWYSMPGQIKNVIDKMFSFVIGGKDISGKETALIACCEEEDPTVLDGIRIPYERTAALNKWHDMGQVLVPGVLEAGAIHKTDGEAGAIHKTDGEARAAMLAERF